MCQEVTSGAHVTLVLSAGSLTGYLSPVLPRPEGQAAAQGQSAGRGGSVFPEPLLTDDAHHS